MQRDAVYGEGVQARVEQDEGVVALPQEVGHSIYNVDQQEQLHKYININNSYNRKNLLIKGLYWINSISEKRFK